MRNLIVAALVLTSLVLVGLLACSRPAAPTADSHRPSVDEEVAEANARLAEEIAAAELVAEEHIANAHDYWEDGDIGLTVTELRAALAAAPWYEPAIEMREQVAASATAEAREMTAVAATATAETLRVAEAAAARERARQHAADVAEAAQILAFVTSFDRTAPPGGWLHDDTPITVAVGNLSYVTGDGSGDAGRTAPRGQRWVSLGVYVKNRSAARIQVNPSDFTLITSNGKSTRYDPGTGSWCTPPLRAADVAPGSNVSGCLVFLADVDSGPAAVVYASAATNGAQIPIDLQRFPDISLP